jgi:hypothetical protein
VRPKGVADGHPVNIPDLPRSRYYDGETQKDKQDPLWLLGLMRVSWFSQANPGRLNSEAQNSRPHGRKLLISRCRENPLRRDSGNRTPNRHR